MIQSLFAAAAGYLNYDSLGLDPVALDLGFFTIKWYSLAYIAGIITGWFAWILRPRRHAHPPQGPFPSRASLESHTPETVLEHVIEPAGSVVMRISTAVRRLQHGRLQAYIIYLLVGVAALALLALWGGAR